MTILPLASTKVEFVAQINGNIDYRYSIFGSLQKKFSFWQSLSGFLLRIPPGKHLKVG